MPLFYNKAERIRYLGFDDRWLMVIGIPVMAILSCVLYGGFDPSLTGGQMLEAYLAGFVYTMVYWLSARYITLLLRVRYARQRDNGKRVLLTMSAVLGIVLAVKLFIDPALQYLFTGLPAPPYFFEVAMAYTLCLTVLGGYEWLYNMASYRRSELERERLTRENMQTQLHVLRQQMNPHFLFNSLNTLASIIPEDPAKAARFTQRLAATYRRILEYRDRETITVREELSCLNDYLFLLQSRFEHKLRVRFTAGDINDAKEKGAAAGAMDGVTIPQRLAERRVVPLAAQLLVENAVKHNVVSAGNPLTLDIHLGADRLTVRNTLAPRTSGVQSTGWGQENLRRRYAALTDRNLLFERTTTEYVASLPLLAPQRADHPETLAV